LKNNLLHKNYNKYLAVLQLPYTFKGKRMIQVTKRSGSLEPLDIEKLHKVAFYACEGITGVSPSEVEIKSKLEFFNGIKSKEIQETLIKAAADLITEETPNYQYVGGRLINYGLRKEVYGGFDPFHIKKLVDLNTARGYYDPELKDTYTNDEWDKIDSFIKHDRDEQLTYVAMEQLRGKYLVQNRVTGEIFETPQMCYALIAATLFSSYPKETRLTWIKEYYDAISLHDISLPTPVMAGVRTPQRQFSSCVLIETDDSLDSISATSASIVKYVSQKAGIGIGAGNIRAINSPIRKGDAYHTGIIPFYKHFQSAVKSCCLTPDTIVEIINEDGLETKKIRIADLTTGMKIKSYEDGKIVYRKVINKWDTLVTEDQQVRLEFTNGTVINCSINHPIMILDNNVVTQKYPQELTEYNNIISENGTVYLYSITVGQQNPTGYVDITVEDTNTFFASSLMSDSMVLTHNSQGGVRGGAATIYYPIWHLEAEELLVLKNNKGTEENRIRHMDYGVQFNKLMYERLITGGNITLFSPSDVPGLYEAFFADQDKFRELYEKAERTTKLRKKTVKASELFSKFMEERKSTGRIYLQNVDNANDHGSFIPEFAPIRQSNLCLTGDTKIEVIFNNEKLIINLDEIGTLMVQDEDLLVKSYNILDNKTEYKKVEAFAKTNPDAEVISIFDEDSGKTIECTPEHKIYTLNRGYVEAQELTETDRLLIS